MLHNLFEGKLLAAVTLRDTESAIRVAEAFLEGELNIMEITFRTQAAEGAISAIAKRFPEMNIGAGTILTTDQLSAAQDAGAQFGLSPGFNKSVARKAKELDFPFIPGVLTPSEIEEATASGYDILKLFPASTAGGADYIKKIEGPYRHTGMQFIPMGGINRENMRSYLHEKSVIAVGGSWLAPAELIQQKKFKQITTIARESMEGAQQV